MNSNTDYDLGQHIICGIGGNSLPEDEATLLRKLRPSGIILFKHNFAFTPNWMDQLAKLLRDVRHCCERDFLFVSIDHEGGKVNRLPLPVTPFPPARNWQNKSRAVGEAMGLELRALGINLNYAPVLDVDLEPTNTVIAKRAFSTDADEVSSYAMEYMRGLESSGVLACGKHFPGHGATIADSHFSLPTLDVSLTTLHSRELVPFIAAIDSHISMLMTAHVLYPQIDPLNPATFSPALIQELLREELGFNGVVVSDALEMGALKTHDRTTALTSLIRAGADMAMFANPSGTELPAELAYRACKQTARELNDRSLELNLIEQSQARIRAVRSHLAQMSTLASPALEVIGCASHKNLYNELISS